MPQKYKSLSIGWDAGSFVLALQLISESVFRCEWVQPRESCRFALLHDAP